MDFIKKNWGLLFLSLISIAAAAVILVFLFRSMGLAKEKEEKVAKEQSFFKEVKQKNLKLDAENVRVAEENRELVEKSFRRLRARLAEQYRVDPDPPRTSLKAMRSLLEEIKGLRRKLTEAEILTGSQCRYMSFDRITLSNKPMAPESIPEVFRQLRIVQELVRLLVSSKIQAVISLERPMELELVEADLHTVTPLDLTVVGTAEQVQELINIIHTKSTYLFFVRNLKLTTRDQAPGGLLAGGMESGMGEGMMGSGMMGEGRMGAGGTGGPDAGLFGGAGSDMMGEGMMGSGMMGEGMMGEGGMMGSGMMGSGMMGSGMMGSGMMGEGGMMGSGMMGEGGMMGMGGTSGSLAPREMFRDMLRPFSQDRYVTAEIRLDLVEFTAPAEEEE